MWTATKDLRYGGGQVSSPNNAGLPTRAWMLVGYPHQLSFCLSPGLAASTHNLDIGAVYFLCVLPFHATAHTWAWHKRQLSVPFMHHPCASKQAEWLGEHNGEQQGLKAANK
eukprot:scaffold40497_cov22-Tisochrysis_lutea.AAC.1